MKSTLKRVLGFALCVSLLLGGNISVLAEGITDVSSGEEAVVYSETEDVSSNEEESIITEEECPDHEEVVSEEEASSESDTKDEENNLEYLPYEGATYRITYKTEKGNNGNYITITGMTGTASGELVIPGEIDGLPVEKIADDAFESKSGFTGNLVIPENVKEVGYYSFSKCTGLNGTLSLPSTLGIIGSHAFDNNPGLMGELVIPDSVYNIEFGAFFKDSGFTSLVLGNSLERLGYGTFQDCTGLTGDLYIPENLTRIEQEAFKGDTNLNLISVSAYASLGNSCFPEGVEIEYRRIYSYSYELNENGEAVLTGLTGEAQNNLIITNEIDGHKIVGIGEGAFKDLATVKGELRLPDALEFISSQAFANGSWTGTLTLPSSLKEVAEDAFKGCTGWNRLNNGGQCDVFLSCQKGEYWSLNAGENVSANRICAGENAQKEEAVVYKYSKTLNLYFGNCQNDSLQLAYCDGSLGKEKSLVLPDEVDTFKVSGIGRNAFEALKGFKGVIIIPKDYVYVSEYAFVGCGNISGIENESQAGPIILPDSGTEYCWVNDSKGAITEELGALDTVKKHTAPREYTVEDYLGEDGKAKIKYVSNVITGEITLVGYEGDGKYMGIKIPSQIDGHDVTRIGYICFNGGNKISAVVLPEKLKSIEMGAFAYCSAMGEINIPDSVVKIGGYAFEDCAGLSVFSLPNHLEEIGELAFYRCGNISGTITIPETLESLGDDAFTDCKSLQRIVNKNKNITVAITDCCKDNEEWVMAGYYTGVDSVAPECTAIKILKGCSWQYANGVEYTYNKILINNTAVLTGCNISEYENVKTIVPGELDGNKVVGIGNSAFKDKESFSGKTLTIPEGVTSIGAYAFSRCGLAGSLVLPESLVELGDGALEYCAFKGIVVIPRNLTKAGNGIFNNVSTLDGFENNSYISIGIPNGFYSSDGQAVTVLEPGEAAYVKKLFLTYVLNGESFEYTGSAIKPEIVYAEMGSEKGTEVLTLNCSVSYKNNVKPYTLKEGDKGFSTKKAPSMTIKFYGNLEGQRTFYFTINKKDLAGEDIIIGDIAPVIASGKSVKPVPTIKYGSKTLKNKADFTVAYYDNEACEGDAVTPRDAGTYFVKITGKGNYTGCKVVSFEIKPKTQKLVSKLTIGKINDRKYTGNPIKPDITIKDGKTVLTVGKKGETPAGECDVYVSYTNNTEVGKATVLIEGTGTEEAKYVGSKTVTFKITGTSISKMSVSKLESFTYDGNEKRQAETIVLGKAEDNLKWVEKNAYDTKNDEEKKAYAAVVTYTKNTNAGTATMIFTGVNGYTGTLKKTFKIVPYDLKTDPDNMINAYLNSTEYEYSRAGAKPEVTVEYDGTDISPNYDYSVSYANNTVLTGSSKKVPTVKIKGKGNFKNTISITFDIVPSKLSRSGIKIVVPDVVYSKKAGNYKNTVTITDGGKKLTAGKDYEKTLEYTYVYLPVGASVLDGSKKKMPVIERNAGDAVGAKDVVPAGTVINVTVTGKGNFYTDETQDYEYRVVKQDINKLKISVKSKEYTGARVSLSPEDISFKNNKQGDVTFNILGDYSDNINCGKVTVTIEGTGNYGGRKTISYTIKAKPILRWFKME